VYLAKVKGNIVSTQKNNYLKGHKLLIVEKIDIRFNVLKNSESVAIDLVDAGVGDVVLIVKEGAAVQQILGHSKAPVNTMIIAIVDSIDLPNQNNELK